MKPILNNTYTVGDGYYEGEKMVLQWVAKSKNIFTKVGRMTQASGTLIDRKLKINCILELLVSDEANYKILTKLSLIKLIKRGDKKAKKEFIVRYKSIPKF